jgi:hypothetical protein
MTMSKMSLKPKSTFLFTPRTLLFFTLLLTTSLSCNDADSQRELLEVGEVDYIDKEVHNKTKDAGIQSQTTDPEEVLEVAEMNNKPVKDEQDDNIAKGVRKLVKEGKISLKATDMDSCKRHIDEIVRSLGGYYEKEDLINNENAITYSIIIRIQPEKFENLVSDIESGKNKVLSKNIRISDAMDEYVDIQSRIESKRAYLNRYRALLSKAGTIKNILEIEEIVRSLQEELESQESRLANLKNSITLGTLTLDLITEKEVVQIPEPVNTLAENMKNSFGKSLDIIEGFILWIIEVWPQLLAAALLIVVAWRKIRSYLQEEELTKPA